MLTPLLQTKLFIPPLKPDLVTRPDLIERLNDGLLGKLTLISAPAGFGKTTLVSEWISSCGRPIAWVSLEEGDNEPVRFIAYLIAALRTIDENIGHVAHSMLAAPQLPVIEPMVTTLINDLATLPGPFALVLDDYHTIHMEWIYEALEYLIIHQPPQAHMVIVTREDPPLPLSRLRVRGEVAEFRVDDLRFTTKEVTDFLNKAIGLSLEPELITALEIRTGGWAAGLQLAALALQAPLSMQRMSPEGMAEFITAFSGSHRYVIDYLTEEVLSQQPGELREFLIQTAALERLSAPLCDAVTDRDDSKVLIRQLEQANLFLIPLDDQRKWYRYHPLFADFLRTELDQASQADLHLKAAQWFASHGLFPEAVNHAIISGDMNEVARVIKLAAEGAFRSAAYMTLQSWLDALPDELVREDYELATYKGLLLILTRNFSAAAECADNAESNLPPDAPSSSRGRLLSLQAQVALCHGSLDSADQLSREALEHFGDGDTFFQGQTLNVLGQVLQTHGDIAAAAEVYREGVLIGLRAGDQQAVLPVFINLVFALNELGQRREALAMCQQAIDESTSSSGRASPWTGIIYLVVGLLSFEANELDLAREQILRALELCRQMNFNDGILFGPYILAQVHLASGEIDEMSSVIRDVRQFAATSNLDLPYEPLYAALEAQASLQQGDLTVAARWAKAANLSPVDNLHPLLESVYFVYIRILLVQNRFEQANDLLSAIERSAREGGRLRKLITVYLQQALVEQAMGQKEQAISNIEKALLLAAPEGYTSAFLDEGIGIVDLLRQVPKIGGGAVIRNFVIQVLDAVGVESSVAQEQVMVAQPLVDQPLVDPLSKRELQVLRLLAAGLSSNEVAEELYIAVGTSRTHIKNIYAKLNVHNRIEAVTRAQELDLL